MAVEELVAGIEGNEFGPESLALLVSRDASPNLADLRANLN
jgi:hypothetical protein